jgi:hypothetical protein
MGVSDQSVVLPFGLQHNPVLAERSEAGGAVRTDWKRRADWIGFARSIGKATDGDREALAIRSAKVFLSEPRFDPRLFFVVAGMTEERATEEALVVETYKALTGGGR